MLARLLVALSVVDMVEDSSSVLVCPVVVPETVVSLRVDVTVLRSVVAGTVRKVDLCKVVL